MITEKEAKEILAKQELKAGIAKYKYIMEWVRQTDVSTDTEFQIAYRDFYRMRRFYNDEFALHYFKLMEQNKTVRSFSFKMALERVKHIQGTYEMSFSSKMAHTINPDTPIWDSIVTGHFGIRAPGKSQNREMRICETYDKFKQRFYDYMEDKEGQMLLKMFEEAFPESGISDVKKIDFILWQDR